MAHRYGQGNQQSDGGTGAKNGSVCKSARQGEISIGKPFPGFWEKPGSGDELEWKTVALAAATARTFRFAPM